MDSFALKKYLSKKRVKDEKKLAYIREKYFVNIYFHSLFLYSIFNKFDKDDERPLNDDIEELLPDIFKPFSTFLLHMDLNEKILSLLETD